MASWDDGYVTDVAYTSNFYRETAPSWLAAASLLLGQRPPDLTRPFRYADLGCAHGLTAITVAATCPHAEVWGFDFNPAHVESARHLAAEAGLSNIRFVETSFADLASLPAPALPEFDIIAAHGVLGWISPENQQALTAVFGQRLRPGGLAYLSYNVATGWSGMAPLRRLMHMLPERSPDRSDLSASAALDFVDRLKAAGAAFFPANPALESRLNGLRAQDARYLAHEFLNRDWYPLMFADVAARMATVKCAYVGSATLSENIDAVSVPAGLLPLMTETRDQHLRETLRDFAVSQGFRRDIYRRGLAPMPATEHQARLNELTLAWTGTTAGEQVTIKTSLGELTGRPELYRPLLAMLQAEPLSIGRAASLAPFAGRPLVELLQAFSLLLTGGFANPVLPGGDSDAARAGATRLNAALARLYGMGAELPRLATPLTGMALTVDGLELLAIDALLNGAAADPASLGTAVMQALKRSGRSMRHEGEAVTDPARAQSLAIEAARGILERRVPLLRSLGVLP